VACSSSKDSQGTSYLVPAAETVKNPRGRTLKGLPAIEVWWSRNFSHNQEETLVIRQEYEDRSTADVIEVTLGQLYDLIDALNKAVENS
jgi:hypothetical protein